MQQGISSIIYPYKNRPFDPEQPVYIYRNLKGKEERAYSVRQGSRVVGHTNQITLKNCKFIVNKKGQSKVRKTKQENVHAYVFGSIDMQGGISSTGDDMKRYSEKITYDPYMDETFVCGAFPVKEALSVMINEYGVTAAYLN